MDFFLLDTDFYLFYSPISNIRILKLVRVFLLVRRLYSTLKMSQISTQFVEENVSIEKFVPDVPNVQINH